MKEAMFYRKEGQEVQMRMVRCELCPHSCVIANEKVGVCKARKNIDGVLYSMNYGEVSSIALDPIEKKPLFHFYPGRYIISVGTWGCNFRCAFCQNWEISQQRPYYIKTISSADLVNVAVSYLHQGNIGISYTYNEPLIWYEYVYETSKLAKEKGLKNVLVTNGFINEEPLREIVPFIDAMNIDLKGLNDDFYRRVCGGRYEPVLNTIEHCVESGVHVEVTTLVIPGENDSDEELEDEFKMLSDISDEIPLHLSRYHPAYRYTKCSTDVEELKHLYELSRKYLKYVYLGNVWDSKYESTYCPNCHSTAIIREGFKTKIVNLDEEGRCKVCNNQILRRL
ncbi:MAG TPA: AmmeMemoRadiSam system radical SAM enzyme [Fervidobacterium sp.]|nr:AmmeMemoRadiSam system radical SAM enzyme [Fervidobacterium sp.]HPT53484.1 AmmeMemoRadiSam system radical SAM enzyme [Fervidobacterium sp.]